VEAARATGKGPKGIVRRREKAVADRTKLWGTKKDERHRWWGRKAKLNGAAGERAGRGGKKTTESFGLRNG